MDSEDEWVGLGNLQTGPVDMSGYVLVLCRGFNSFGSSLSETRLGGGSATKVVKIYGTGVDITAVDYGDRIVVGNPTGAMPFDFYLELRDETGALLDAVEVGGNAAGEDRGGDGIDNGAPAAGSDGRAMAPSDEAIDRVPDLNDTGSDTLDFAYAAPSIGAPD